jgi:hypothetical protein
MASHEEKPAASASFPVRRGPYQYVRVRPDGTSSTVTVDEQMLHDGVASCEVAPDDRIVEVALSSTSDPDLDPPRGQLWPSEAPK